MTKLYTPITLILADDHEIFRDGFKVLLKKQSELELIDEASNGKELVDLVRKKKPEVVVTDIKMPVMNGIEATRILTQELPYIGVIALSMFDEENLIVDMLEAGAKGYLLKNAKKEEIISAVKTVNNNQSYYCNHTTIKLAQMIARSSYNPYKKNKKVEFSEKEIAIINFICEEHLNKEIANQMNLSTRTVEGYREKILEKMNVKNTAGIVVYAIRHNIYKI